MLLGFTVNSDVAPLGALVVATPKRQRVEAQSTGVHRSMRHQIPGLSGCSGTQSVTRAGTSGGLHGLAPGTTKDDNEAGIGPVGETGQ